MLLYYIGLDEFSIAGILRISESTFAKCIWSWYSARVLQHPIYIWQVFSRINYSITLWWFCWLRMPLFRIFSCYLHEDCLAMVLVFMCMIMQLWGNIPWLILKGLILILVSILSYLRWSNMCSCVIPRTYWSWAFEFESWIKKSEFLFLGFIHSCEVFSHGVATLWVWVLSKFCNKNWWKSTRDMWLVRRWDLV